MPCKHEGCDNPSVKEGPSSGRDLSCHTCKHTLRTYGITGPQRQAILDDQGGVCLICESPIGFHGKQNSPGKHDAVLDHCHTHGTIRGILCGPCNLTLGTAYDSPEILRAAANYLEER